MKALVPAATVRVDASHDFGEVDAPLMLTFKAQF